MRIEIDIPDALLDAVAERVLARLPRAEPDRYVSREEAVEMGIERRALLRAEREGRLPAYKPGREVVYRAADVRAMVEGARVAHVARKPANDVASDPFLVAMARARQRRASMG